MSTKIYTQDPISGLHIICIMLYLLLFVSLGFTQSVSVYEYRGYTPYTSNEYEWNYQISYYPDGLISSINVFYYPPNTKNKRPVYGFNVTRNSSVITSKTMYSSDNLPLYTDYHIEGNRILVSRSNNDRSDVADFIGEIRELNPDDHYEYYVNDKLIMTFFRTDGQFILESPQERYVYYPIAGGNNPTVVNIGAHAGKFE